MAAGTFLCLGAHEMVALGLGTVQFGMPYGIANEGRPSRTEVAAILARAAEHPDVTWLDTAREYGEAEEIIGAVLPPTASLRIVSKTPKLPPEYPVGGINNWLRASTDQTLRALRRDKIDALLIHHAADLEGSRGDDLWAALELLRDRGVVERIGLSAYRTTQILSAAERFPLQIVQLPINALDQRLVENGTLRWLRSRGIEIHARSLFLQGLLLLEPSAIPTWLSALRRPLKYFRSATAEVSLTPLAAAFAFINGVDVDAAIVGVVKASQLEAILAVASCPASSLPEPSRFAVHDPILVDPSQWRRLAETANSHPVLVRPASAEDARDIFVWRNDPRTRQMFRCTAEVSWETHRVWFEATVCNPFKRLLVGEHEGRKIGAVRFDSREDQVWQISINLAPAERGRGLGTAMLRAAIAFIEADVRRLQAEVRRSNLASRRMFERCHFRVITELDDFIFYEYTPV